MRESPPARSGAMMNGAVYISFFQGQLESVLEQVVQLAVQEISKTVGSSLNALLQEAAAREQENRQLRLQLQSRGPAGTRPAERAEGAEGAEGAGSASAPEAGGELAAPEPRLQPARQRAPGAADPRPRAQADTRRLQQRGRIVDQLRAVMDHVLAAAVRELTKIVEASFDDLLLQISKMEAEQQELERRLGQTPCRGGGGGRGGGPRRPAGSGAGAELPRLSCAREEGSEPLPILSLSQDWTPVLDRVFDQSGSEDVREQEARAGGGRGLYGGKHLQAPPHPASPLALEPSPSSPQQDPRWTPLENMEVFSPDDSPSGNQPPPEGGASTDAAGPSGCHSSASMLQRLLTLPSQLMDDDQEAAAAATETQAGGDLNDQDPSSPAALVKEEEEDRGRKKRRRLWSECGQCGQRFSRKSLLKAHLHTHAAQDAVQDAVQDAPQDAAQEASGPSPPRRGYAQCGRRTATGSSSGWTCRIRPDQNQNP